MTTKDPRYIGRQAIQDTVDPSVWEQNVNFTQKLQSMLLKHPLSSHPIKEFFENETLDDDRTLKLHFEFGHGFAQIFTDAVIRAMYESKTLESRLGPKGKSTSRFLWALNLMDELGYVPSGTTEHYAGHPDGAHYFLYMDTIDRLGGNGRELVDYEASAETKACRATFEDYYSDYALLTTVLALSESIFDKFAGAWADNVNKSSGLDTSEGYHTIHVEDEEGSSIDDDHSEDGWCLVNQAITPDRYAEIELKVKEWLDVWYKFADKMIDIAAG
jgi:hypothetical protein